MSAYSGVYGSYEPNALLSRIHMLWECKYRKDDRSYYNKNSSMSREGLNQAVYVELIM